MQIRKTLISAILFCALAFGGMVAVTAVNALAPSDTGLVATAQAKTISKTYKNKYFKLTKTTQGKNCTITKTGKLTWKVSAMYKKYEGGGGVTIVLSKKKKLNGYMGDTRITNGKAKGYYVHLVNAAGGSAIALKNYKFVGSDYSHSTARLSTSSKNGILLMKLYK